ncbi:MAG: DUF4912 domain-containing protein [Spirochaetaceae bacterium]|jgi:hypothetical protein|nr:DUF4912 domain-containing protein [Spirochaetaceae bacterium]
MTSLWKDTTIYSFSRAHLESFTSQELLTVAAQLAVDLPQGIFDRARIIGEILDAVDEHVKPVQNSEREWKYARMEAAQDPKTNPFLTVRIPERYNITYITALVRDPLWFFVFWEVKESLLERLVKTENFEGLCLRINALKKTAVFASYHVSVGNNDKAWYLDFPSEGDMFFVELCAQIGGREEALAKTRSFRQPDILPACEGNVDPLAALSGIRDLPVLREKIKGERP